jgi:hypothetical protein
MQGSDFFDLSILPYFVPLQEVCLTDKDEPKEELSLRCMEVMD